MGSGGGGISGGLTAQESRKGFKAWVDRSRWSQSRRRNAPGLRPRAGRGRLQDRSRGGQARHEDNIGQAMSSTHPDTPRHIATGFCRCPLSGSESGNDEGTYAWAMRFSTRATAPSTPLLSILAASRTPEENLTNGPPLDAVAGRPWIFSNSGTSSRMRWLR